MLIRHVIAQASNPGSCYGRGMNKVGKLLLLLAVIGGIVFAVQKVRSS